RTDSRNPGGEGLLWYERIRSRDVGWARCRLGRLSRRGDYGLGSLLMRRRVAWMWMRTLKALLALPMLSLPFVLPSLHDASNVEIAKLTFQVFIAVFVLARSEEHTH